MNIVPEEIDGAKVDAFNFLDERHTSTGNCRHSIVGQPIGPVAGLVIARYRNDDGFYLFRCDAAWNLITDTFHPTFDEAKYQAEFEYRGTLETWTIRKAQQIADGNGEYPRREDRTS